MEDSEMPILFFVLIYLFPYALVVYLEPTADPIMAYPLLVFILYYRIFKFRTFGRAAVVSIFSFENDFSLALIASISALAGAMTVLDSPYGWFMPFALSVTLVWLLRILKEGPSYGWDV